MQFTLRQRQMLGLWGLLTVLCGVAGPFGTHDALGLFGRAAYWGAVIALSIAGSLVVSRIMPVAAWAQAALWVGYAVVIALLVFLLNTVLFPQNSGGANLPYLIVIVGLSVLVINGMIRLGLHAFASPPVAEGAGPDAATRFLRRVPLEIRAPLVRIEAQDHYLNVVTTKGSALILLRLAEAVEELEDAGGLQTHRSHWVNLAAVTSHKRVDGRDVLILSDAAAVPVARTRRDAAREAGLF